MYTCFGDFTKAFDYIDRTALYYKILNRGIEGNLLNIIKNISRAECPVKWDSRISDIMKSEFGVLQSGMLSPNERYTTVCGSSHYGDNIIEKAQQYKYLGVVYS